MTQQYRYPKLEWFCDFEGEKPYNKIPIAIKERLFLRCGSINLGYIRIAASKTPPPPDKEPSVGYSCYSSFFPILDIPYPDIHIARQQLEESAVQFLKEEQARFDSYAWLK